jgi:hypothetical protein
MGVNAMALTNIGSAAEKRTLPFRADFRRYRWSRTEEGLLICPTLADRNVVQRMRAVKGRRAR